MDDLRTCLDVLEHHIHTLHQHTHTITRQLRWWRGVACGLLVLALLAWGFPVVTADDAKHDDKKTLEERVAALEKLLKHFRREGNEITIRGANLHIVNGLGSTDCFDEEGSEIPDCPNGLGNLIVGYNEPRDPIFGENIRTGSHNVVVGQFHNFSRFGGLVVGELNEISGGFAVVSGGRFNTASGDSASVTGGNNNLASGPFTVVSGGSANTASGFFAPGNGPVAAVVSGGGGNTASGNFAVVSGGESNIASFDGAVVSGGARNTASGLASSVSGGGINFFNGEEPGNTASGDFASVSGGQGNTASGFTSSVSGGLNRTAAGDFDWVAGSLFEDE
jgi:hypothetical protein